MDDAVPTTADLRARRGRLRVPIYELAPAVGLHPGRLGGMLNDRIAMPEEVVRRIARALDAEAAAIQQAAG